MKQTTILGLFILFLLFSGCSGSPDKSIGPEFQHFKIAIEQDDELLTIDDGEVELEKESFSIIIYFSKPDSIFINASFTPESFNAATEGKTAAEIPGFSGTGIEEELFNKEEYLHLSLTDSNFWHYAGDTDHRFSTIVKRSGILICKRSISKILDLSTKDREKRIDIDDVSKDTLYLVFMKMEWNEDYSKRIEKKRQALILKFD